jgi:hypothetical protein
MRTGLLAWTLALLATGCCCMKGKPCPPPSGGTAGTCGNQSIDPTCSALVATAFCQAKAPTIPYGGCELWATSRGFEITPANKGKPHDEWTGPLSFGAPKEQTCQQACEVLGEALTLSSKGWKTVVYEDGHPMGIADFAAQFRGFKGTIYSIGGRPDSVYLEQDTPYADWCCCARGCDVGTWGTKKTKARKRK